MSDNLKPILEASYKQQKDASSDYEKLGYTYDPELSTMESKVFVNKTTGKPSVAFRGSTRVSDWLIEDPAVALGIETPKQKKAKELVKKVESKYGQSTDVYGHSLGGYRAEKSGASGNIYTYNKAVGLGQIGKKLPKSQTDVRTTKDIVSLGSLLQYGGKKITIQSPTIGNAISAHNISNLDQKPKKESTIGKTITSALKKIKFA
jgi:hypothetical protein